MDGSRADLIIAADGQRIRTADDLLSVIESKRPGEVVEIVAVRDGKERVVHVTLGASEP
jgi:S1-C subfamily serine protease